MPLEQIATDELTTDELTDDVTTEQVTTDEVTPERAAQRRIHPRATPRWPVGIRRSGVFAYAVARAPDGRLRLAPAYPLWALLVLFPVWWALGFATFIFPLVAIPMVLELRRRRRTLRLPIGWIYWALFLLWTLLSLTMYMRSPAGVHLGSLSGRVMATALLLTEYVSATVTLVFVGNLTADELPINRLVRWLSSLFVVTVIGGLVGTFKPYFQFRAPLELILPHRLRSNAYLETLIHPAAAQIQAVLGSDAGRAAAPFGYTNFWANNLGILMIWFFCAWIIGRSGWRRNVGVFIVAISAIPIVYSLNRGLWIGLAVAVVWVVVRMAAQGKAAVLVALLAALAVGGILFVVSPLHSTLNARLAHPQSNDVRSYLYEKSIKGAEESPLVGWGGARRTNGSSQSIAVGNSAACNSCGDFTVGSVGQLSQVLFYQGILGTLFFFGFFLRWVIVGLRDRSTVGQAGSLVVALTFVFALFYNSAPAALTMTMIAVGLLWRSRDEQAALAGTGHVGRRILPVVPVR